MKLWLF
jgi:hypothetical protein